MGLSPNILISEVRNLRNKVEHEFSNPQKKDVLRACEVAELLINNLKAKELYSCAIDISDIKRHEGLPEGRITGIRFNYVFRSQNKNESFYIYFYDKNNTNYEYYLKPDDKIYYYFLKAMFVAEFDTDEFELCIKRIVREIKPDSVLDEINITLRY